MAGTFTPTPHFGKYLHPIHGRGRGAGRAGLDWGATHHGKPGMHGRKRHKLPLAANQDPWKRKDMLKNH